MKVSRTVVVLLVVLGLLSAWLNAPAIISRVAYAVERGSIAAAREGLAEMSRQDTISPLIREVARVVRPAVVEVRVTRTIQQPDMSEFFRRFFRDGDPRRPQIPEQRQVFGLGSGVIVDADEGYVITNYHVVGGADRVKVVLADGRELDNEWIRTDPQSDLAVIKLKNPQDLIEAPLGDSAKTQVGDMVLAIGAPSGLAQTVTMGIISATGRATGAGPIQGLYQDYLQTDAAINRGNSGGPLVNMRGEVIGINNMIVSSSGGNEGIGFSIPSNMVRGIMQQLIERGEVLRGFLGVTFQDVDVNLARSFNLPDTRGALVTSVVEQSPADQGGIETGDFIVAIDDQRITSGNDLRNAVANRQPGETVTISVMRRGEKQDMQVTLAAQPEELARGGAVESMRNNRQGETRFGLQTRTLTQEIAERYGYSTSLSGAIITDVRSNSNAAEQGLRPGMVITRIQDIQIETAEDVERALNSPEASDGVRLLVTDPQGQQRFIFLVPQVSQDNE